MNENFCEANVVSLILGCRVILVAPTRYSALLSWVCGVNVVSLHLHLHCRVILVDCWNVLLWHKVCTSVALSCCTSHHGILSWDSCLHLPPPSSSLSTAWWCFVKNWSHKYHTNKNKLEIKYKTLIIESQEKMQYYTIIKLFKKMLSTTEKVFIWKKMTNC